jgi:hypothetical protein
VKLAAGEKVSAILRVLEEPKSAKVGERKLVVAKVSDAEDIANLIAWDSEAKRLEIRKGDVVELLDGVCPRPHTENQPPMIEVTADTRMRKLDLVFPSVEECMRPGYLADAREYEYAIAEGFITRVKDTAAYVCEECGLTSGEVCECGLPATLVFRITGVFSDGTRAMDFCTLSERVAEELSQTQKKDSVALDPQDLMRAPHRVLGYVRGRMLYVEEVL